jgi:hypothetical protein
MRVKWFLSMLALLLLVMAGLLAVMRLSGS